MLGAGTISSVTLVIVGMVTAILLAVTSTVSTAAAGERTVEASPTVPASEFSAGIGIEASGFDPLRARTAVSIAIALDELKRAAELIEGSDGKASSSTRLALVAAFERLQARVADADPGTHFVRDVEELRSLANAVTDEVTLWEQAEAERLAEEARAAEEAAAAASAAAAERSYSFGSTAAHSTAASSSQSSESPPAPAATHEAAPPNDGCGPCPGATLVPIEWDGQMYWGCP